MNREAIEKLHLDRRLTRRRGWISEAELAKAITDLPDVSDKIAPPESDTDDSDSDSPAGNP